MSDVKKEAKKSEECIPQEDSSYIWLYNIFNITLLTIVGIIISALAGMTRIGGYA